MSMAIADPFGRPRASSAFATRQTFFLNSSRVTMLRGSESFPSSLHTIAASSGLLPGLVLRQFAAAFSTAPGSHSPPGYAPLSLKMQDGSTLNSIPISSKTIFQYASGFSLENWWRSGKLVIGSLYASPMSSLPRASRTRPTLVKVASSGSGVQAGGVRDENPAKQP
uniref:Uncharacterized protein n=1 Tax=Arundo donax TaxID=35708 RepID=A0A0A9CMI1_ARUDO